jgi:MFS family permease
MHPRVILSVGNFFFSIFSALMAFILFPYLSLFMPSAYIGFIIAGSAIIAVIAFPFMPEVVERYGAQKLALVLAFGEMLVLLALAASPGPIVGILLMALSIATQPLLSYGFDLMLEATIADTNTTGRVRALFRTAWSVAALAAPLLLGALLANSDSYARIFIAGAAMLVPIALLFVLKELPKGPPPEFYRLRDTMVHIWRHRDLLAVMFGNLLLYLFYVWMPLYTPFYLHNVLGFAWSDLGLVFAVMLIPYVVVEYPASWAADKFLGDKELMFAGFLIAGGATATLGLITKATSLSTILVILVISRIGAALIEAMVEAHFFRRVSRRDIDTVSVFRSVWPLAYFIGPLVASTILITADYSMFFLVTGGIIALAGMITSLLITDFR